jgi:hypothetical protein
VCSEARLTIACFLALASVAGGGGSRLARAAPEASLRDTLRVVDERQQNAGDWRSVVYVEQKARGKVDVVYETLTMRRSADQKFLILFTKPKAVQGQGYLLVEHNLWFYDASVGKWERRTERERIGGTDSRRADFDESHLCRDFDPEDGGEEKLGVYATRILVLKAKPQVDVAYPLVKIWIDKATKNVLKRQEFALSGRLLRTSYYTKWTKLYSASKKADVWYAQEMRFFDELDKETSTLLMVKSVDPTPLPANVFTKAWVEGQSR